MRIGIDARVIYHPSRDYKTKVGHYIYSLIKGLEEIDKKDEFVLFFDSRVDRRIAKNFENKRVKIVFFPFSAYRKFLHIGYSQLIVGAVITKEWLDVFHAASGTMPFLRFTPSILSIFKIEENLTSRLTQKRIIKSARLIIVPTSAFKEKLVKIYKLPERKIEVISEADKISDDTKESCTALAEKMISIYKKVCAPKKSGYSFFRKIIPSRRKQKNKSDR